MTAAFAVLVLGQVFFPATGISQEDEKAEGKVAKVEKKQSKPGGMWPRTAEREGYLWREKGVFSDPVNHDKLPTVEKSRKAIERWLKEQAES